MTSMIPFYAAIAFIGLLLFLLAGGLFVFAMLSMSRAALDTKHQAALEASDLSEFDKGFIQGAQGAVLTGLGTALLLGPALLYVWLT